MIRKKAKIGNINDKISSHFNKFKTEIKFTLAKNLKLHTAALKKIKKQLKIDILGKIYTFTVLKKSLKCISYEY